MKSALGVERTTSACPARDNHGDGCAASDVARSVHWVLASVVLAP